MDIGTSFDNMVASISVDYPDIIRTGKTLNMKK